MLKHILLYAPISKLGKYIRAKGLLLLYVFYILLRFLSSDLQIQNYG